MKLKYRLFIFLIVIQTTCLSESVAQHGISTRNSHHRYGTSNSYSTNRYSNRGITSQSYRNQHSQLWHGNGIYRNSRSSYLHAPYTGGYYNHRFNGFQIGPYVNFWPGYNYPYGTRYYPGVIAPQIYSSPLPPQRYRYTDPQHGLQDLSTENRNRWKELLDNQSRSLGSQRSYRNRNSSTSQKSQSLRHFVKGNLSLRKSRFSEAVHHYNNAIYLTPNESKPHLHIALAYAGLRNYLKAVVHLKKTLVLDPSIPFTGQNLFEIFGPQNQLGLSVIKTQVVRWTNNNIRDHQRLFLLGFILHFSNSKKQAAPLFEAAYLLSKNAEYLIPFRDYYRKFPPENQEMQAPVPERPAESLDRPLTKPLPLPPNPKNVQKEETKKEVPVPDTKPEPRNEKLPSPKKGGKDKNQESGPILIRPGN